VVLVIYYISITRILTHFSQSLTNTMSQPTAKTQTNDWNSGTKSGLVSIGTHNLHVQISGGDHVPTKPTVLVIPGVTNSSLSWRGVARLAAAHTRILLYDRSGFNLSESSPLLPSPENIAKELQALLRSADVKPPYILLAHSWGGIIAREVIALFSSEGRLDEIAGLILVDANQLRTNSVLPWMDPVFGAVQEGLDWLKVQDLEARTALTADEWEVYVTELNGAKHKAQAMLERGEVAASYAACEKKMEALKKQRGGSECLLGSSPVCVVRGHADRDLKTAFEAGLARGNGTKEERARYRELVESWEEKDKILQGEALKLSSNRKWMEAVKSGHDVQLVEPDIIVEAIEWVTSTLPGRSRLA
jgi:pimeloyl-ACP methyl ester carboxylesterase